MALKPCHYRLREHWSWPNQPHSTSHFIYLVQMTKGQYGFYSTCSVYGGRWGWFLIVSMGQGFVGLVTWYITSSCTSISCRYEGYGSVISGCKILWKYFTCILLSILFHTCLRSRKTLLCWIALTFHPVIYLTVFDLMKFHCKSNLWNTAAIHHSHVFLS